MRKLIVIAAALAALAIPTAAMAATYDANGVGTVAKGDVMQPLGLNEAAFQNIVKPAGEQVTFTHSTGYTWDQYWTCSDGSEGTQHIDYLNTAPVTAAEIWNTSSHKVTGWNLSGYGTAVSSFTQTPNDNFFICPAGSDRTSGLLNRNFTVVDTIEAHVGSQTVTIPNTPVLPTV